MGRLDHKIALVTGGGSGIGSAIAQRLAADGARVVITDLQVGQPHTATVGDGLLFLEQDVCDETRWSEIVREVEERYGQLDILVNNAGIIGPTDAMSPESSRLRDWKAVFAVNVEGVFLGCRTVIPAMRRAGGGSIINLSSIAALQATPYATAYGASKAAVHQFTKSVAQHCAQQKLHIRCNSVHPGTVRTALWDKFAAEIARQRGVSIEVVIAEGIAEIPLGDFTRPQDVAAAVAFLASDDARHVTGTQLIVDGGITGCDTYHALDGDLGPG